MRAASIGCGLLMAGLALVPVGCGEDVTDSASERTTSTVAHADHAARAVAPPTTAAAPSRLDIVATEYDWTGLPDELPTGTYPATLRNDGVEGHEISIFRNPDHVPLDELLELGPEGIKGAVEMAGTLIAGPNTSASGELALSLTPGEYEVVCFFPAASDGRAHFAHGMQRKLIVR